MEKKYSILIIDDEDIVDQLCDYFRKDYTIHKAYNGEEAVDIFNENEVHLVMTDQRIPKIQGTELLARFKEEKPEVTRILMTGYTDLEVAIDAINKGSIHRYLQKPLNLDELSGIIEEGLKTYEQCSMAKNLIAQEKDDIIGKIKNVFSQIKKDVEGNKERFKEELCLAKEMENKVCKEMEEKKVLESDKFQQAKDENMKTQKKLMDLEEKLSGLNINAQNLENEIDMLAKERDSALEGKTRVEMKLKHFQANWAEMSQE